MSEKKVVSLAHRRPISRSKLTDEELFLINLAASGSSNMRDAIRVIDGLIEKKSAEIKRLREQRMRMKIELEGSSNKAVADRLGVPESAVQKALRNKPKKHIETTTWISWVWNKEE